jgi:hypothetical protein
MTLDYSVQLIHYRAYSYGESMIARFVERHFAATLLLLVTFSRLPALVFPVLSLKESDIAVETMIWVNGGVPFVDFVETYPLLIHTWYRLIFAISGPYSMVAVHVMDVLLVLATVAGVYAVAKYISGEKVARWAAIFYAFFQSFFGLSAFLAANPETLMNAIAVLGTYVFFKSMREDRPGMSLVAGALYGFSILASPAGWAVVPACAVSMIWFWYEQTEHHWHRYIEEMFLLIIGVMFPITVYLAFLADATGLSGFFTWAMNGPWRYPYEAVGTWSYIVHALSKFGLFIGVSVVLWVISTWSVVHLIHKRKWRVDVIFFAAWIVFTIIAMWWDGRFYMQSFLQLLPPLAILAAIGVVRRWNELLTQLHASRKMKRLVRTSAIALFLIVPYVTFFIVHILEVRELRAESKPVREIAAYIASHTNSEDKIFVWGRRSDIYMYSERLPASRFVNASYLSGIIDGYGSEYVPQAHEQDLNAWIMLKRDFKRHPPKAIIDFSFSGRDEYKHFPIDRQMFLANFTHENYSFEDVVGGARIYFRKAEER